MLEATMTLKSKTYHIPWVTFVDVYIYTTHGTNSSILGMVNSSPPSAPYMRLCIGSALFHIMACSLFGANQLSKLMLP